MAQGPPTITGELKQNYTRTKDVLLRAAAKMPDEGYYYYGYYGKYYSKYYKPTKS